MTDVAISHLGQNLRHLRTMRGFNQRELSVRTGVSQATISRVEAGSVQQIRSRSLMSLASALEVSVEALMAGPGAGGGLSDIDACVLEESGCVKEVNDLFVQLTGHSPSRLEGRPVAEVVCEARQSDGQAGDLSSHTILRGADGTVTPVDVRVRSRGTGMGRILYVRDDRERRHELALSQLQRSLLECTTSNMEPVLQAMFGELLGLGVDLRGLGVNLIHQGQDSFVAHTLLRPARLYVDDVRQDREGSDFRDWLAHWQRRDVWIRPGKVSARTSAYQPVQVIDIPFPEGTLAAGLGEPHNRYVDLLQLLQRMGDAVGAGVRRLRQMGNELDDVIRAAWHASRFPAVILDSFGVIRAYNPPWRLMSERLGVGDVPEGGNLLEHCGQGRHTCHHQIIDLVQQIQRGERIESMEAIDCDTLGCPLCKTDESFGSRIRACRLDVANDRSASILVALWHRDGFGS